MAAWDDYARLADDALVERLVEARLPELAHERNGLIEVLRARLEDVARRAYGLRRFPSRSEQDFVDWLFCYERLFQCLAKYVESGRRGQFLPWFRQQAHWQASTFLRWHRRRRTGMIGEANEPPARDPNPADAATGAGNPAARAARGLARIRSAVETLSDARRVPFKLVHFRELELTEVDWQAILKWSGRPRAEVEAALAAYRASERKFLTLAEAGALIGKKEATVGQAVKRASDDIARRLGGPGGSDDG